MKGITIAAIGYFIIAFVTIILIIGLIGTKFSPAIRNFYCSFSRGLRGILPLPEHMKPPLPSYCRLDGNGEFQTVIIEDRYPEDIEFKIAAYCLACWERTGRLNKGQSIICYELVLKRTPLGDVMKDNVNQTLVDEGYPTILEWKTGSIINSARSIGISYNADSKKIEVV